MKLKSLKIIGLFTVIFFVSLQSYGQTLTKAKLSTEWQLINEQEGVQIFIKNENCNLVAGKLPFEYSFLKIVNTTDFEKSISYNYIHQFVEGCDGCGNDVEKSYTQTIAANSSIEDNCDFKNGSGLSSPIQNHNFDGAWKFVSVEIKIISVK